MATVYDNAKQQMITLLQQQPEDSTYDELLRELAFARMINRGLKDLNSGRTIDNDSLRREIQSWRTEN